jgi:RNA polymerase sigma-B factor
MLQTISPRAREMLRLRFEEDLTQAEIAELFGVSQMQVSRVLREAITRLRCVAVHRRLGGG